MSFTCMLRAYNIASDRVGWRWTSDALTPPTDERQFFFVNQNFLISTAPLDISSMSTLDYENPVC